MKPQRVYAEINLDLAKQNMKNIMALAGKSTFVMAVVKADGYGHGAVQIAKAFSQIGIEYFGVATVEEAVALRDSGVTGNILILSYAFSDDFERIVNKDIISTVFDFETAKEISDVAVKMNKTAKLHIKLDTGMGRIGFLPTEQSVEEIKKIKALSNILIEGIYSHLACADDENLEPAKKQIDAFNAFYEKLENAGVHIPLRHIRNSAGTINFPDCKMEMVRCGMINFGLYPSDGVNKNKLTLTPVMQLKSHISFVKTVPAGFTVSYGSTFVTQNETKIATVPVGYGDGYPRALSSVGRVIINGNYAPIIGRVCMDQFMIDVTGMNVKRGDEAILIGTDGEKTITVDEIAEKSHGFNYEIICNINDRVPRVYVENGVVTEISYNIK